MLGSALPINREDEGSIVGDVQEVNGTSLRKNLFSRIQVRGVIGIKIVTYIHNILVPNHCK